MTDKKKRKGREVQKLEAHTSRDERRWSLEGMTARQAEEANAIEARVIMRGSRAEAKFETNKGQRALTIGIGSTADKTLHSMRLYEALGSKSHQFTHDVLNRLPRAVTLTGEDARDSATISAALAFIGSVESQNVLETTMALQMVAANEAALLCFERSRTAQYMEQAAAYSNMANKAMRSFALHAEAIAKLRRGGEQVVKHVHVNEGGQAVIAGTVNTGRGV